MPIEAQTGTLADSVDPSIGRAYLDEARRTLDSSLRKIMHCLDQLSDSDLCWRSHESHNSIQNVILHLCGNVRQWIIHGVGGVPDTRNRSQEFSDRRPIARADLVGKLRETVAEASAVLAATDPARLLAQQRIQGFDTTLLAAIFDSSSHFVGHTHQIVYIARLRLGDAYKFQWVPTGPEQGGTP